MNIFIAIAISILVGAALTIVLFLYAFKYLWNDIMTIPHLKGQLEATRDRLQHDMLLVEKEKQEVIGMQLDIMSKIKEMTNMRSDIEKYMNSIVLTYQAMKAPEWMQKFYEVRDNAPFS